MKRKTLSEIHSSNKILLYWQTIINLIFILKFLFWYFEGTFFKYFFNFIPSFLRLWAPTLSETNNLVFGV